MEGFSGSDSASASKKRKSEDESTFITHISQLPEVIFICIISLLPTKDLMVASLVSRYWKRMVMSHLSTVSSSLKLNEIDEVKKFIADRVPNPVPEFQGSYFQMYLIDAAKRNYVDFVTRTLALHAGCIIDNLKIWLHYDGNDRYAKKIVSWVHFSVTNTIREFSLDFAKGDSETAVSLPKRFDFLDCEFSNSRTLQSLSMTYCKIDSFTLGSMFSLHKLVLKSVEIYGCSIGKLLSRCPVLEEVALQECLFPQDFMWYDKDLKVKSLSLVNCTEGTEPFDIFLSAPELVTLVFVASSFGNISLRNAKKLENATIDGSYLEASMTQGNGVASLLYCLDHCNTVSLHSYCIQVLPTGNNISEEMPNYLTHVQHLKLTTGLGKQELPGIACLIRSCPALKTITLTIEESKEVKFSDFDEEIFMYDEDTYWDTQDFPFLCFDETLKEVVINGFKERKREIDVASFLLNNAPLLEKMEIYYEAKTTEEQKAKSTWYPEFDHPLSNASMLSERVQVSVFKPLVVLDD